MTDELAILSRGARLMNGTNEKGVILIADDDKEAVRDLKSLFTGRGYDVLAAPDKAEAITTINAISFDVIILEVNMSHGIEILKHIKVRKPRTKIIVYSKCDCETQKKAEEIGIDKFLPKNAEMSMLVDTVQNVLKR